MFVTSAYIDNSRRLFTLNLSNALDQGYEGIYVMKVRLTNG